MKRGNEKPVAQSRQVVQSWQQRLARTGHRRQVDLAAQTTQGGARSATTCSELLGHKGGHSLRLNFLEVISP